MGKEALFLINWFDACLVRSSVTLRQADRLEQAL